MRDPGETPDRKDQKEEKYTRLTTSPLYPLLWRMAIPSMIGMMMASVYSMTDTYFVGKLGRTDLTAAVGIVFSFLSVIQAVGFWFGYGSGNEISRLIGRKNDREAEKMASAGFAAAAVTGIIILISGLIFIRPLSLLLGAGTSKALNDAVIQYLRITLIGVPVMLISNVLYNQLRLQGAARDSMTGLLAGMLLNMLLDPLFILKLQMGVAGAAAASLVGQSTGAVLLLMSTRKNGNVPVYPLKAQSDLVHLKKMLAGGAPNFCRQGITSISGVVMNHAAGAFGEPVLAGMTIALRLLQMGYALVIGFGQGFQPICAVNYGAGKHERIKKAFLYALGTVTVFLMTAAFVFFTCGQHFILRFSSDPQTVRAAADFLRAFSCVLPFMGYYILIGMFMQNIGRFGRATLITTMENGIFLIPLACIFPLLFGYSGLIWCKSIASICSLLFSALIGMRAFKKYLQTS